MTAGMPMTPVDAIDVHTHVVPENFPRYSGVTADLPWPSMDAAHAAPVLGLRRAPG